MHSSYSDSKPKHFNKKYRPSSIMPPYPVHHKTNQYTKVLRTKKIGLRHAVIECSCEIYNKEAVVGIMSGRPVDFGREQYAMINL